MKTPKQEFLYEQEGKSFYSTGHPDFIIQRFNSNGSDTGKQVNNSTELCALKNEFGCHMYEYLTSFHIPTHFVKKVSDNEMMVKKLKTFPLQVNVYNAAIGEFAKRFGVKNESPLEFPVIEHYHTFDHTKAWLNEYHASAFGIVTPEEFKQISRLATKVNAVLRGLFERRNLELALLKLEFGKDDNQIYLGGELSLSTFYILDGTSNRHRFILNGEPAEKAYIELRDRLLLKV